MLARVTLCQYQTPPEAGCSPTQTTLMPSGGIQAVSLERRFQKWVLPSTPRSSTHSTESGTGWSTSCFLLSSSSFLLASNAEAVRKESVAASTPSAEASASDATTRRGAFPEERRTVRSLLCGPGSTRLPGRTPGGGVFCPRRASCVSCTTSSLMAVAVYCLRGAEWCVASATAIATVIRSWRCH